MRTLRSKKVNNGFTLIELLVVISIISLLSTVVLSSLNSARQKARDAQRMHALTQMRVALELYANDHDGAYPLNKELVNGSYVEYGGGWLGSSEGCQGKTSSRVVAHGLVEEGYISKIPEDPNPDVGAGECFVYYSTGTDYQFLADETIEGIANTQDPPHPLRRPNGNSTTFTKSLSVYTDGAKDW